MALLQSVEVAPEDNVCINGLLLRFKVFKCFGNGRAWLMGKEPEKYITYKITIVRFWRDSFAIAVQSIEGYEVTRLKDSGTLTGQELKTTSYILK